MKYVLLFVDTEQFASDLQAMGLGERERAFQQADKWFADHVGKLRGGSKLRSPETATTVRLEGGEPVITDGPFVEGKEVVSGYAEIEVADLDEALRMVRTWPGCPVVEIRRGAALQHWPMEGIPQRPDAWLFAVAHRRAVDLLRREGNYRAKLAQLQWPVQPDPDELLRELGHPVQARAADRLALELTANPTEQAVLQQRITWT